eukprot:jgi/Tetstr1/460546/TSEL_005804.t1
MALSGVITSVVTEWVLEDYGGATQWRAVFEDGDIVGLLRSERGAKARRPGQRGAKARRAGASAAPRRGGRGKRGAKTAHTSEIGGKGMHYKLWTAAAENYAVMPQQPQHWLLDTSDLACGGGLRDAGPHD